MAYGIFQSKLVISIVLAAVLTTSGIGVAYAYSSIVNSSGTITTEYLTINVYDGAYSDTDPPAASSDIEPTSTASLTDMTPEKSYSIRISSNVHTEAYVYGYFECSSDIGKLVKDIVLEFTDGTTATLYKDAIRQGLTDSTAGTDSTTQLTKQDASKTFNYVEYQISKITVDCYDDISLTSTSSVTVYEVDASGSGSSVSVDRPLSSLSDFDFTFLTSATSLIHSSA